MLDNFHNILVVLRKRPIPIHVAHLHVDAMHTYCVSVELSRVY